MAMGIFELFGLGGAKKPETADVAETLHKITEAIDKMEPEQARYVASFAFMLGRVAHADLEISKEETREMERIVETVGGLPVEQAILVVQIAKSQNKLFGGTDNYSISQEFEKRATRRQKLAMLNCLFAVSSSDKSISTIEDNEIRKIASELRLEHGDFIGARSAFREHLEVLKRK